MEKYTELKACLICGSDGEYLENFVDLGEQPLANNLINTYKEQPEKFPLKVNFCHNCYHSQLSVSVNPEILFKNYFYATGTSKAINDFFKDFVNRVEYDFYGKKLRVLEIASNDGTLLKHFKDAGHAVLGVDPAENLAKVANEAGVDTVADFWGPRVANDLKLSNQQFDVIIAQNVVAHVPNPVEFMKACKEVLAPGGRIYVQTSQANMLFNCEFDTIYHEHLSFFSARSFLELGVSSGLIAEKISILDIHGDSYLVEYTSPRGLDFWTCLGKLKNIQSRIEEEAITPSTFDNFRIQFDETADRVKSIIKVYDNGDRPIIGFGAAAKGITFLQYANIDLGYIIDDTPWKQNKFIPGKNIAIVNREYGFKYMKDKKPLVIIFPWNFYNNIKQQLIDTGINMTLLTYFPEILVEEINAPA